MNNLLQIAKNYLKHGLSVIPLKEQSKTPLVAWTIFQKEKPDEHLINSWFTDTSYNLAIVTGTISNLVVLDCDTEEAVNLANLKGLPKTACQKTGRGYQFFFQNKKGIRNFQKRADLPGIDLRGEGGYVVAPPSIHPSGAKYEWVEPLIDWMDINGELPELPDWVTVNCKEELGDPFKPQSEGNRNQALARAAGKWSCYFQFDEVLAFAREWNKNNNPPLSELEVFNTCESIWKAHSKQLEQEKIKEAEANVIGKDIINISSLEDKIINLYNNGLKGGESTGWPALDQYYTIRKGEWSLVTGIPGHGKTTVLDNIIVNLAKNNDWKIALFSAENLPHERHVASLIEKYLGKSFQAGFFNRLNTTELKQASDFLNQHFFFINPAEDSQTVDKILELTKYLIQSEGISGLVIDPWNELDHTRPANVTETEYISTALTKLRRFARVNKIHIWIVAHPAKLLRGKDGKYPVPTAYDVHGSAHWRNKADNAICVWRDVMEKDSPTEIHVQKIRFREVGMVGLAKLKYEYSTTKYLPYEEPKILKKTNRGLDDI